MICHDVLPGLRALRVFVGHPPTPVRHQTATEVARPTPARHNDAPPVRGGETPLPRLGTAPRPQIFYGWYIVAIALVAQFVAVGTQTYASTAFLKPMNADLGWTRSEFSAVQTVATVVMGVFGFAVGMVIDRRGPRLLMFAGGIICGAALIATSQVNNLWEFYLARGVAQTVGATMLGSLVVNVTVAKWFVTKRGMAIAIASAGVSLGGVLMTPVVIAVISAYGWRDAWVFLGVLVWVLILPSAFIMRRAPEDQGLLPDGRIRGAPLVPSRRPSLATEAQWTREEAVRTPTLWLLISAYGIANVGIGAMLLHLIPFLTDHGWSTGRAAWLYSIQAWAALVSKPLWGALMDRFHPRYLSALGFLLAAGAVVAILGAVHSSSWWPVAGALALWGLGVGGAIPLQETIWANYFTAPTSARFAPSRCRSQSSSARADRSSPALFTTHPAATRSPSSSSPSSGRSVSSSSSSPGLRVTTQSPKIECPRHG